LAVVQQSHLLLVTVGFALVFSPVLVFLVFGPASSKRRRTRSDEDVTPPTFTVVAPPEEPRPTKALPEEQDEMLLSELPPAEEPRPLREAPSEAHATSPPPRAVTVPPAPVEPEVPEMSSAPTALAEKVSEFGSWSVAESQGGRSHMEDTHFVRVVDDGVVAGVFDGCGGGKASNLARDTIVTSLQRLTLTESIARAEKTVLAASRRDGNWPDACAVVLAKVTRDRLDVAWCGDSRALLALRSGPPVALTRDHNAGDAREEKRVKGLGGKVARSPQEAKASSAKKLFGKVVGHAVVFHSHSKNPKRVFPGGITLTRCLGALPLKFAKPQLVLADPEVVGRDLDGTELFLLLASDGIFEMLSDDKVVDTVKAALTANEDPSKALVAAATASGSTDNITALVLNLRPSSSSSSSSSSE